jgi:hypothetical protein
VTKGWHFDSPEHSLAAKGIKTKIKKRTARFEDTIKVSEILPEYEGEIAGGLTLNELKETYPPFYRQIKHWEELGKGFTQKKKMTK